MRFALALCFISTPVLADEYIAFHSPSGNIHCGLTVSADYTGARCDIFQITAQSFTSAPADCEFDWGNSFAVDATGGGYLACVSDTVADDAGLELGYGQEVSLGGITCSSAQSGMTCTNDSGHGFTVSKAKQSVF
ncbi:MAG: hypothetical protein RI979_207 [Pseudomonadota bacterium]|jgi:hypothetical protein